MTNDAQEEFNELFLRLSTFEHSLVEASHKQVAEKVIYTCLHMAQMLVQDEHFLRIIGKELRLITWRREDQFAPLDLSTSLVTLENDLEENLRGFSGLLNLVLEDVVIRRDPLVLLNQVPNITQSMRETLHQLALTLIAYLDLKDVFLVEAPKAMTALFLVSVSEIFDELAHLKGHGDYLINHWLKDRVKNCALESLFKWVQRRPDVREIINFSCDQSKDLLITLLCVRMARGPAISKDEESQFDTCLKNLGMMGLLPLVESGALALEDGRQYDGLAQKTELRIFRIN